MATTSQFPDVCRLSEEEVQYFLKAQTHIGSKATEVQMENYIFKRRKDGKIKPNSERSRRQQKRNG